MKDDSNPLPAESGTAPDAAPDVSAAPANVAASSVANVEAATPPSTPPLRVVLGLGEAGEICSIADACLAVLGWEQSALVGQNIRVLLGGGLDNEVGRALHRQRAGEWIGDLGVLRLTGLRKDGTEFPATVSTVSVALAPGSDKAGVRWTVALQPVQAECLKRVAPEDSGKSPAASEPSALARELELERAAVSAARDRIEELEKQVREAAAEGEALREALSDPGREQLELRAQLEEAREAAGYAEAALKEETTRKEKLEERLQTLTHSLRQEQLERSKRFEEELVNLRGERDELNVRLNSEQGATTESARRAEELAARLIQNAAEVERANAELEKQTMERERSDSAWREQLDTAWVMKKEIEGAFAGAVEQNKLFEEELAALRQERDELNARIEAERKAASDSQQRAREVEERLGRNATDFDRTRSELEKQSAERERSEAEWREELAVARTRKEKLERTLAEAQECSRQLEKEAGTLRLEQAELQERLIGQQQEVTVQKRRADEATARLREFELELESAKSETDQIHEDQDAHESEWREQVEELRKQKRELETSWAAALERSVQLEEELAGLRRVRDELNGKWKSEQQTAAHSSRRFQDLEAQLARSVADHERLKDQATHHAEELARVESEWGEQVQTAKALTRKLESAWTAAVERSRRAEEELSQTRQERDDLKARLAAELHNVEALKKRLDDQKRRAPVPVKPVLRANGSPPAAAPSSPRTQDQPPVRPTEPVLPPGKPSPAPSPVKYKLSP